VDLFVLHHSHEKNNSAPSFAGKEILRKLRSAALWLIAFQFLAYLLCCLLPRVDSPMAEMSVLEELLGRIVAGDRHAPGSLSSLFVDVRMARH
jgi:hypothetical protein